MGLEALTQKDLERLAQDDWAGYCGRQRMIDFIRRRGLEAIYGSRGVD